MLQLIANDKIIETFGDGETNKTLIFQAYSGDKVIIQDIKEKHTQINIETKKIDYDLYIFEEGIDTPSIIIKDYFAIDEISLYAYNANGALVYSTYTQINNVDGLLNLVVTERVAISTGQLALGGLAIGVVGTISGRDGNSTDTTAPSSPSLSISNYDNDGKPTASGIAEPNSIITITWSDGTKSSTKADNNGNYSIKSSFIQLDGDISVTATDASGNESTPFLVTWKDTQTPALIENIDENGKSTATGATESDSNINIILPNENKSATTINNDVKFPKESPNTEPEDGGGTIVNEDFTTETVPAEIIIIDTTYPTATITIEDMQLSINETSTIIITFSESVKNFDKEDVIVENGTLSDFVTTDNVTWSATFTPNTNVLDNTNNIILTNNYSDIFGNTGTAAISENYEVNTLVMEDLLENESLNDIENLLQCMPKEIQIYSPIPKSSQEDFITDTYSPSLKDTSITPSDINLSFFNINDEEIIATIINQATLVV